nr:glycerophosphodiester phosphodiesterase family protein [Xenorhabdus nematophila]
MCVLLLSSYSAFAQSPKIVAHRAGTTDAPENTFYAIDTALKNKADAIWITAQLSKDNQLVLYRPSNLNALTDHDGTVSNYTTQELAKVNASYQFSKKNNIKLPLQQTTIPLLESVLKKYPDVEFYIDLKSPDANPDIQAKAVLNVLNKTQSFEHTRFYSTNEKFLDTLSHYSDKINVFESRDQTRTILANSVMSHHCELPQKEAANAESTRWYGFELHRKIEVVERYTLGEARSPATLTWDKDAIDCFRKISNAHIILFGVNNLNDYQLAKDIGADAVMVDSPQLFQKIRN